MQGNPQMHMMGVPTTMQQSHPVSQVQQQPPQHQQGVRMNMVGFCAFCFFCVVSGGRGEGILNIAYITLPLNLLVYLTRLRHYRLGVCRGQGWLGICSMHSKQ